MLLTWADLWRDEIQIYASTSSSSSTFIDNKESYKQACICMNTILFSSRSVLECVGSPKGKGG